MILVIVMSGKNEKEERELERAHLVSQLSRTSPFSHHNELGEVLILVILIHTHVY